MTRCCDNDEIDLNCPSEQARFALQAYQWVTKQHYGCQIIRQAACGQLILGLLYLCRDEAWDFEDMVLTARRFAAARQREAELSLYADADQSAG